MHEATPVGVCTVAVPVDDDDDHHHDGALSDLYSGRAFARHEQVLYSGP